jgi:hypothetical protein
MKLKLMVSIIAISLVGMAQEKTDGTVAGIIVALKDSALQNVRCTVTQKEAGSILVWRGGLGITPDPGHAVAFQISYTEGTPYKEVERCIQQMHDSASTQQYFKEWAESKYSNADVSRLWEIYVGGKLVCFVGKPKGGEQ